MHRRTFIGGMLGFFGTLALPVAGNPIEPRTWAALKFHFCQHSSFTYWQAVYVGMRNDGAHFYVGLDGLDGKSIDIMQPFFLREINTFLESDCSCGPKFYCPKHERMRPRTIEEIGTEIDA